MATILNNSANVKYEYGESNDSAKSNIVTTILADTYSLLAEKTSSNNNWRPSENLTFNIRIENNGTEPIYAISVQDNLGGNPNRLLKYITGSGKLFKNDILTTIVPTSTDPLTFALTDSLLANEAVLLTYIAKVNDDIDESINSITNEITVAGHEESVSGAVITVSPNPSNTLPKANYASIQKRKIL